MFVRQPESRTFTFKYKNFAKHTIVDKLFIYNTYAYYENTENCTTYRMDKSKIANRSGVF